MGAATRTHHLRGGRDGGRRGLRPAHDRAARPRRGPGRLRGPWSGCRPRRPASCPRSTTASSSASGTSTGRSPWSGRTASGAARSSRCTPTASDGGGARRDAAGAVGSSGTGTNTQEADVDESDVAKTDGSLVVRVTGRVPGGHRRLRRGPVELSRTPLPGPTLVRARAAAPRRPGGRGGRRARPGPGVAGGRRDRPDVPARPAGRHPGPRHLLRPRRPRGADRDRRPGRGRRRAVHAGVRRRHGAGGGDHRLPAPRLRAAQPRPHPGGGDPAQPRARARRRHRRLAARHALDRRRGAAAARVLARCGIPCRPRDSAPSAC